MRRSLFVVVLAGIVGLLTAGPASAHGEKAEEPYQRMKTIAWWDTAWSAGQVAQGSTFTITGSAKLLETWPINLSGGEPKLCYLNIVTPGATFSLRDRKINGVETPHSFFCQKGDVIQYQLTIAGRDPGYWHVHPAVAVKGSGTLIGPGKWVTVTKSAAGFSNNVQLYNGKTVNLENYGTGLVVVFSFLTFILGMIWMIYWTWNKRTVTRLAVTNQLHLNDDGGEAVGLITRKDHRWMAILTGVTLLLVAGGMLYQAQAYPTKIPIQSYWFTPPKVAPMPQLATATAGAGGAVWESKKHVLTMNVHLTNTGQAPIQIAGFNTSNLTFVNRAVQPGQPGDYNLQVQPATPVAPGQSADFTAVITQALYEEHLVVTDKPQLSVGGVFDVRDNKGGRQMVTFESDVSPTYGT